MNCFKINLSKPDLSEIAKKVLDEINSGIRYKENLISRQSSTKVVRLQEILKYKKHMTLKFDIDS